MAHGTTTQLTQFNLKSILSVPGIYRFLQYAIAGSAGYEGFVDQYVRPQAGDRILDIGCGPGDIVTYLDDVNYIGFDENPQYIESAKDRFGDRATFYCSKVSNSTLEENASFDIVLAVAILHHLDDVEALQLCQLAGAALKPGGRFISLDACYTPDQSPLAKLIISQDRGQYVRNRESYLRIVSQVFPNIHVSIRHDRLRIPYTHVILECCR